MERCFERYRRAAPGQRIEHREGVYSITRTRISLDSIVDGFREEYSPETILEDFEGLTLAHVYSASAFYLDHQADIDAYLFNARSNGPSWSAGKLPAVRTCALG